MRNPSGPVLLSILLATIALGCAQPIELGDGRVVLEFANISVERLSRGSFSMHLDTRIRNDSTSYRAGLATLTSESSSVTVTEPVVGFSRVAPGASAVESGVVLSYDRRTPFDVRDLEWRFDEVDAGPVQTAASCAEVSLIAVVPEGATALRWETEGAPPIHLDRRSATEVAFRAPSVAATTSLELVFYAEFAGGIVVADVTHVMVEPGSAEAGLAAGMARDCSPFEHGVASGDPTESTVLLWTRITTESAAIDVDWEIATDPGFETIVGSDTMNTDAVRDFTVVVEADGLDPGTTYYYRFRAPDGSTSALGRTRSAASGAASHVRFAVASCSSIYSGYFNGYRRIAERQDLDLMIHVGDYVYDFVDEDEQVRVPDPFPVSPENLAEWRALHAYHLTDPDLRWARAMHPWLVLWDNHDVESGAPPDYNGSVQAFREWVPMRQPDPSRPEIVYRRLVFGDLVEVLLMDALLFRGQDTVPGSTGDSILGNEQASWLESQLAASQTAWRVIGTQKLFSTLRINPSLAELITGERQDVFDLGSWDGFPEARTRLIDFLTAESIGDNVFVTGDSHISLAFDVVDDPANEQNPYVPETSSASVGVELMPTSISRGNFDETLIGQGLSRRAARGISRELLEDTLPRNPHAMYGELVRHGYGVLDVTPERVVAEIWYSNILERSDEETLGVSLTTVRGTNQWVRDTSAP